jgi:hypothetical protein
MTANALTTIDGGRALGGWEELWALDRGPLRELPQADLQGAAYARDLTDPFGATEDAGAPEPPWLETRFLEGTR